jgi:predicted hotdog family 3-hydroxylacyl-ACP dehydratase
MTGQPFPPTIELAPHKPPMLLVDRIVERMTPLRMLAQTRVSETWPFVVPGRGVPSYVGFELMAQSVSILDGLARRDRGLEPSIGLLLGCRRYELTRSWFAIGEELQIDVEELADQGELKSFDCWLRDSGGEVCASGAINVFRPNDVEAYFAGVT